MGMTTSLFTGATGLVAHGEAISIVGDNIANTSTYGYKAQRAGFADILGGTGPSGQRLGGGVRMGGVTTDLKQGTILATGNALDLGVSGAGYFVVRDERTGQQFYTRDGRFRPDAQGAVVNADGLALQGYPISPAGVQAVAIESLRFDGAQSSPQMTSKAALAVNLQEKAAEPEDAWPAAPVTDTSTLAAASNFATSMQVYDSKGAQHRVDVYFRKTGVANSWEWKAFAATDEVTDPASAGAVVTEIGAGDLTFTSDGKLQTQKTGAPAALPELAVTFGTASAQTVEMSFGDDIDTPPGTGLGGSTQFATASTVNQISQNGFGAGVLTDVSVSEEGTITGRFSNGQTRDVAKIALAMFNSNEGLQRSGHATFIQSTASGEPLIGTAGSGGTGTLNAGSLEASNVDLGSELVTMIAYQRAFQANARTVTTSDELMQEVANLKR